MHVAKLRFIDPVLVDTSRLNAICDRMGPRHGESAICAAMEDLAALLHTANALWHAGNLESLDPTARQVCGIANRIGLSALASAARDVAGLCAARDGPALAATLARMSRLGEGSLIAIWEAQDISI